MTGTPNAPVQGPPGNATSPQMMGAGGIAGNALAGAPGPQPMPMQAPMGYGMKLDMAAGADPATMQFGGR